MAALLMGGCATKSDGVGLFSENSKDDRYSFILMLKDVGDYKVPLCEDGTAVLNKSSRYSTGYYPTVVYKDQNTTTHIVYNQLKEGTNFEIIGCYPSKDKDILNLKVVHTKTEIKLNERLDETNFDNVVQHYNDSNSSSSNSNL